MRQHLPSLPHLPPPPRRPRLSPSARRWLAVALAAAPLAGCPDAPPPAQRDMGSEPDEGMYVFPDYGEPDQEPAGGDPAPDMDAPDAVAPPPPPSCTPCEEDADCDGDATCVQVGADELDRRCLVPCGIEEGVGAETGCDEGAACTALSAEVSVCVPEDEARCEPFCYDLDGDGYGVGACPERGRDCNDADPSVHQFAADPCDGVDNDCDSNLDEDFVPSTCGAGACVAQSACVEGAEQVCVPPSAAPSDETCDGRDDDCDGALDEDYAPDVCGEGLCVASSACVEGAARACAPSAPTTTDDLACDGADQDCDGLVDEDFSDSCGQGLCARPAVCEAGGVSCAPATPDPLERDAGCDLIDQDCDGRADEGFAPSAAQRCGLGACARDATCAAGAVSCAPGAPLAPVDETCDGVDDDCDGEVDEECQVNTLSATYSPSSSTPQVVALDVYYVQERSPLHDGVEWQPTTIDLALRYPAGMTPANPSYVAGPATLNAGKSVTARQSAEAPNTMKYLIVDLGENSITPIAPADPANPQAGRLITLYFNVNGAPRPWSFSWDAARTNMAGELAQGALELNPISPIP